MEDKVAARIIGRATMQERYVSLITAIFSTVLMLHQCAAEVYVIIDTDTVSFSLGSSTSFLTSPTI